MRRRWVVPPRGFFLLSLVLLTTAQALEMLPAPPTTLTTPRRGARLVQYVCADVGWSLWLSMLFLEEPKPTKVLTLAASVFFLASSVAFYPEVNWPCVAMQLAMLAANLRRTVRLFHEDHPKFRFPLVQKKRHLPFLRRQASKR
mmetsp:Transcript_21456/g.69053  ORF Transcript_21456/g.69053 Transcript_21456/m.69053 type:complete len:144 (-) Transcript_21456:37-468(-)